MSASNIYGVFPLKTTWFSKEIHQTRCPKSLRLGEILVLGVQFDIKFRAYGTRRERQVPYAPETELADQL